MCLFNNILKVARKLGCSIHLYTVNIRVTANFKTCFKLKSEIRNMKSDIFFFFYKSENHKF